MKKVFAFLLIIASLCSCEPKNVRDGREAYDYMLSRMYYEYKVTNEHITNNDGQVVFSLILEVREKGGEPLKTKIHKFTTEGSDVISFD